MQHRPQNLLMSSTSTPPTHSFLPLSPSLSFVLSTHNLTDLYFLPPISPGYQERFSSLSSSVNIYAACIHLQPLSNRLRSPPLRLVVGVTSPWLTSRQLPWLLMRMRCGKQSHNNKMIIPIRLLLLKMVSLANRITFLLPNTTFHMPTYSLLMTSSTPKLPLLLPSLAVFGMLACFRTFLFF